VQGQPQSELVQFGVFELDLEYGELRKGGIRIRLTDQSIRVLKCLIARPGKIVTREELIAELWPDGTHVDFENGINGAVKKLRVALGDSGNSSRYIETLPRRGYRLIVPVNPLPRQPKRTFAPARQGWFSRVNRRKVTGFALLAAFAAVLSGAIVLSRTRKMAQSENASKGDSDGHRAILKRMRTSRSISSSLERASTISLSRGTCLNEHYVSIQNSERRESNMALRICSW
jgi:DNA-binding winged helix-turn-helix (wHTH) protein